MITIKSSNIKPMLPLLKKLNIQGRYNLSKNMVMLSLRSVNRKQLRSIMQSLKPDSILIPDPELPIALLIAMARHLPQGSCLLSHHSTKRIKLEAIARVLPLDVLLVPRPDTKASKLQAISKHMKPGAILMPSPKAHIQTLIDIAQNLHPGAVLRADSAIDAEKLKLIAQNLNPGACLMPSPKAPLNILIDIAQDMKPGAYLVPHPCTGATQLQALAQNLNPNAFLARSPSAPINTLITMAQYLNPGARLIAAPWSRIVFERLFIDHARILACDSKTTVVLRSPVQTLADASIPDEELHAVQGLVQLRESTSSPVSSHHGLFAQRDDDMEPTNSPKKRSFLQQSSCPDASSSSTPAQRVRLG